MTEASFAHLNPAFFPSEVTPVATEDEAYEQAYEQFADESAAIAEEQFAAGAEVVLAEDPEDPVDPDDPVLATAYVEGDGPDDDEE